MSYLSRMNATGGPLADEEKEVLDGLVDNTLAVISQALSKETDDAVSSSGFAAFLTYTRLAKWLGSKSEGYNSALAYLVKPAMKNLSQADFRSRMGALFTASVLDRSRASARSNADSSDSRFFAARRSASSNALLKTSRLFSKLRRCRLRRCVCRSRLDRRPSSSWRKVSSSLACSSRAF